jgi:cytidyltransferase-like protein
VYRTIVVITGGFDPLHSGHINYIDAARKLGHILLVGVNSDEWLARKKGKPFMPFQERITIIRALRGVDYAIEFDDSLDHACDAIAFARKVWSDDKIIFANGGDRTADNIPEMELQDDNLEFAFGVGGTNKVNSSSWILENWNNIKDKEQNK